MGRIRNNLDRMADFVERDPAIKGRELTHIILCMAFEDGHIHAIYPDDKLKTTQMIKMMVNDREFHYKIK